MMRIERDFYNAVMALERSWAEELGGISLVWRITGLIIRLSLKLIYNKKKRKSPFLITYFTITIICNSNQD